MCIKKHMGSVFLHCCQNVWRNVFSCIYLFLGLLFFVNFAQAATPMQKIDFWDDREAQSSFVVDNTIWQSILDKYLIKQHQSGVYLFDYDNVSNDDASKLEGYLDYLQSLEPRQMNAAEQKAYWINLYNAAHVDLVLQRNPSNSIREIRSGVFTAGPWEMNILKISLQSLSLDGIEHGILRPIWNDPRVHFALNIATIGSPDLSAKAYSGQTIETQLEQAAKGFINHPRAVTVRGDELVLSRIFQWHDTDFATSFNQLKQYLVQYAEPELAAKIMQANSAQYQYNWSLNQP